MDARSRATAYSELIAGLLDVRDDSATARFDAELRSLVSQHRIEADVAAQLRWLQRESVQAVVEHATTAVPAALQGIDDARWATSHPAGDPNPGRGGYVAESSAESSAGSSRSEPEVPPWAAPGLADAWLARETIDAAPLAPEGVEPSPGEHDHPEPTRRMLVAGLTSLTGSSSGGPD